MMPLSRFAALADSYGGDIGRWPEDVQNEAKALAAASAQARARLTEAARLDTALLAGARRDLETLLAPGAQNAAVERLRRGVAGRIAAPSLAPAPRAAWRSWLADQLPTLPRLAGLATAGGVVVMAGLLVGALTVAQPDGDTLVSLMQPTPLAVFIE
ncbi:hypothetical protein [Solidesulfovibrio magneticus]|uniref:Uncharacterized protein n=1 Tax=Solidesulfovibrio magneticus (strain ATCC 700980 / DSM 13731 / RS-1) TaxID=573370 RepID=C4XL19_SOLM1|nr:hypothetical protein [Solidesulfovibrio magneticus]BAH74558.1 hypothetical protein DMR_10670 [Solidesulfovibrio magneticus RS-1]